jgi:glycosyltransferase involved in cell wall biosynthesis
VGAVGSPDSGHLRGSGGVVTRIALVHDWLTGMRGGEKALEALSDAYPDADIFTLVHLPGRVSRAIERHTIRTSVLQHVPAIGRVYRHCLPLFPVAIELMDLDGYDLVISTSHCAAKAVIAPGRARHVCYCFTPMRYAWDQFDHYFGRERLGALGGRAARSVLQHLARWDARTAGRVSRYVAISHYVAGRIGRYYNRRSDIVYPPVDTTFYAPDGRSPGGYALVVSALVPYKRIDVAIAAARDAGVPLRIAGEGPERTRLEALAAGADVAFLGYQPDEALRDLYRGAVAVLLPGEEDFGIVPVEAQACGRPVVAYGRGGARETVVDRVTGLLVDDDSVRSFADALGEIQRMPFDSAVARAHAERFSRQQFQTRMTRLVDETARAPEGAQW